MQLLVCGVINITAAKSVFFFPKQCKPAADTRIILVWCSSPLSGPGIGSPARCWEDIPKWNSLNTHSEANQNTEPGMKEIRHAPLPFLRFMCNLTESTGYQNSLLEPGVILEWRSVKPIQKD